MVNVLFCNTFGLCRASEKVYSTAELKPDFAKAYVSQGIAHGEKGESDQAIAFVWSAIATDWPNSSASGQGQSWRHLEWPGSLVAAP